MISRKSFMVEREFDILRSSYDLLSWTFLFYFRTFFVYFYSAQIRPTLSGSLSAAFSKTWFNVKSSGSNFFPYTTLEELRLKFCNENDQNSDSTQFS